VCLERLSRNSNARTGGTVKKGKKKKKKKKEKNEKRFEMEIQPNNLPTILSQFCLFSLS
jgi:hypothetical protein